MSPSILRLHQYRAEQLGERFVLRAQCPPNPTRYFTPEELYLGPGDAGGALTPLPISVSDSKLGGPSGEVSRGTPDSKEKSDKKKMLWRKLPNTAPTEIFILITSKMTLRPLWYRQPQSVAKLSPSSVFRLTFPLEMTLLPLQFCVPYF